MSNATDQEPKHPIGVVCRRTGLKPDLIRAWERRYGAIEPSRSETRRRLYTDTDIERLKLLRQAVSAGRGIRHVANLPREELLEMIAADTADIESAHLLLRPPTPSPPSGSSDLLIETLANCLEAIQRLNAPELRHQLERASVALSRVDLLERLLMPLMQHIGEQWREGTLRPANEHLASTEVRSFLGKLSVKPAAAGAPRILVTTPTGQQHELGALMVAQYAAEEGWDVTFLGTDLPAEEIAAACQQKNVRAVALSITYPPDDPRLGAELLRLRELLPPSTVTLVGGRSALAYSDDLRRSNAKYLPTLAAFRKELEELRNRR